jgi:glutathione S-transferase
LNSREIPFDAKQLQPAIIDQRITMFRRGADIIEPLLGTSDYIIGDRFTVTDINIAYGLYLGRNMEFLDGYNNLNAYLSRLQEREHCQISG